MSDETKPEEQTGELAAPAADGWTMPDPVFRSTEGHTPGNKAAAFEGDEHETESANSDDVDLDETLKDINIAPAKAATGENTVRPLAPKKKGGCAQSFLFILGVVGFGAIAIIAAVVYFLFYYRAAESSF
ncbi:hypothetical protein BH10ACI3_BH10ACI3_04180 [soil metagenome]